MMSKKEELFNISSMSEQEFEISWSILQREKNKLWLCPCCKSPVKITGKRTYVTTSDHISDPNNSNLLERDAYQCINMTCVSRMNDIFWDYNGDRYDEIDDKSGKQFKDYCVDQNDAPFGSYARKANVEIYKVGLKDKTMLPAFLCLWFLRPYIDWTYQADTYGRVLKKGFEIKFLKRSKGEKHYTVHFATCWWTWRFLYRRFKRHLDDFRKTANKHSLEQAFKPSFNRSWEYRWFEHFIRFFYSEYYKLLIVL